jgi:SAM-dependent methyltransferase
VGIDPTAAAGFGSAAELYERARPGYPDEAVAWMLERLRVRTDSTVLDLAAGTGKLTRQLVPLCGHVLAVEPVEEMRVQLEKAVPEAEALDGTAEAIPLADNSVDAVTCAQAFHWFRMDEALREIHRALRPGGALGVVWNARDLSDPLQARLEEILRRRKAIFVADSKWEQGWLEQTGHFGRVDHVTWPFEQLVSAGATMDRVSSISFVAAMSADARAAVLAEVEALIATQTEPIAFRYVTEVYAADAL